MNPADNEAIKLYEHYVDNNCTDHNSRFPEWWELSEEAKMHWRLEARKPEASQTYRQVVGSPSAVLASVDSTADKEALRDIRMMAASLLAQRLRFGPLTADSMKESANIAIGLYHEVEKQWRSW